MSYLFSHDNYMTLLSDINASGIYCDYADIDETTERFILLRHDVEFSPRRALELAEIENQCGISSSFFFQITNNAYNSLSNVNVERIRRISDMGHHIGLHFHLQSYSGREKIERRIRYECDILSDVVGEKIDRFSFHRPSKEVLKDGYHIPGLINTYDSKFFTYSENIADIDFRKNVKYIADSRNEWSYLDPWDYPCPELFSSFSKIQILCHPYSWSACGYPTLENLRSVINENRAEFIQTMNNETKYVQKYLDELNG